MKLLKLAIVALQMQFVSLSAYADVRYKYVSVECNQKASILRVQSIAAYNIDDKDSTFVPREFAREQLLKAEKAPVKVGDVMLMSTGYKESTKGKLDYRCILGKSKIEIIFERPGGANRGECGGSPSAKLSISLNGKKVLADEFDACSSFVSIHSFSYSPKDGWEFCFGKDQAAGEYSGPPESKNKCQKGVPRKPVNELAEE